jgi:hypothetical protein
MELNKIDAAAREFLVYSKDHERPFKQRVYFLNVLTSCGWSNENVEAVRRGALVAMATGQMQDW